MVKSNYEKAIEKIHKKAISFVRSGFFPERKEVKDGVLYELPGVWVDNFRTIGVYYWAWIEDMGEGSGIVFFDRHYEKIFTEYLVDDDGPRW